MAGPPTDEERRKEGMNALNSVFAEFGSFLRLMLGVSSGAVVLFINLLASRPLPRSTSWLLVVSIISFGGSAIGYIILLSTLAQYRLAILNAFASELPSWREEFEREGRKLDALRANVGKWFLLPLLILALISAMVSVIALVLSR